jgi:hypothetical protein
MNIWNKFFPSIGSKKFWNIMLNPEDVNELNKAIDFERKQQKAILNGEPPVENLLVNPNYNPNKYTVERIHKNGAY